MSSQLPRSPLTDVTRSQGEATKLVNAAAPAFMFAPEVGDLSTDKSKHDHHLCTIDIGLDGSISAVALQPGRQSLEQQTTSGRVIDLEGRLVTTRLVDAHIHLDKTLTWSRAPNLEGTFEHAKNVIKHDRTENWTVEDVYQRANDALERAHAYGVNLVRTHIDSQPGRRDPAWPALIELREAWRNRIEIQFVASLGAEKLMTSYGDDVSSFAAAHGALLGPVVYPKVNTQAQVHRALDLAERYGLDIDFHTDENLLSSSDGIVQIARAVLERDFQGSVICGHVCAVSMKTEEEVEWIAALVKQADIGVVTMPQTNAFLLGRRSERSPRQRGLAPIKELHARGVPVAAASDNCQDAFNPGGDYNPVDVFARAIVDAQLDAPFSPWLSLITTTPRQLLTGEQALIGPGHRGELIVFDVASVGELIARPHADRTLLGGE